MVCISARQSYLCYFITKLHIMTLMIAYSSILFEAEITNLVFYASFSLA